MPPRLAPKMPLLVVVGINGRQGTSVANAFLKTEQFRIRGLTSSPGRSASKKWVARGVEIRKETFDNADSVRENFSGAAIIFATTNYDKYFEDRAAKLACSLCPNSGLLNLAMLHEIKMGRMIVSAAADTPGLGRFVLVTLPAVLPDTTFTTNRGAYQFRAQGEIVRYLTRHHDALHEKTNIVRPSLRMEDCLMTLQMVSVKCRSR